MIYILQFNQLVPSKVQNKMAFKDVLAVYRLAFSELV